MYLGLRDQHQNVTDLQHWLVVCTGAGGPRHHIHILLPVLFLCVNDKLKVAVLDHPQVRLILLRYTLLPKNLDPAGSDIPLT